MGEQEIRGRTLIKNYSNKIPVIFGGPHVTTFPEIVMKDINVDIAVIGEGELTFREVVGRLIANEPLAGVCGILHRIDGTVKREAARGFIANIDDIPFPAWDLLEGNYSVTSRLNENNKFLMRKPVGLILTSRGCPKECYFCSVKLVWSRKWRARSAKNIVDEIEFLIKKYGYREIHFVDDNSSVSNKRLHEICDELIVRKINIKLATPTGIAIGTLDEAILRKMKKAGFYRFCFGIETGDPEGQKIIKKFVNLEKARHVIKIANKLGFWTSGTFIFGFPHETASDIRKTIEFTKTSGIDFAVIYVLVPQPGTEVYKILKEQGIIDLDRCLDPESNEWYKLGISYFNGLGNVNLTSQQLRDILSIAYKEFLFYKLFSFRTYVNLVRKVKNLEDFKYMIGLASMPISMIIRAILGQKITVHSIRRVEKEKLIDVDNLLRNKSDFLT